jgi:hypothetical protein
MRTVKLASALIAVLALTALAAATAGAAETLWHWLPGAEKSTFTTANGEGVLETVGKASIKCAKSTGTGELTKEMTLGVVTFDFTECKADGLVPANSLGDPSETILVGVDLHNCLIAAGDRGILFKLLSPLHLEIPATDELVIVEGSFVGLVEPFEPKKAQKEYTLNIKQKGGKQEIEKCEGGTKETLKSEFNENKKPEESGEEAKGATVKFTIAQEAMA